jgi:hypothetical protein
MIVLAIFAVGVALWGFAGWGRIWRLFAPKHEHTIHDPFYDR